MKYNFCKNCGSPVQPGMPNCQRCGAPVDQIQPVDENKPMAQPPGMLRQYYGDNNGANNPQMNGNYVQPAQPVNQPMNNQGMMPQQPMGQPMNNMQQPMSNPMGQPMNNMQQPMYQQPMPQQYNQIQQGNGGSATGSAFGSLACGIIAFFIFWWLSIVGIGLGITACKTGKAQNNNTAFIVGIIGILACIADIVLFALVQSGTIEINLF